MTSAHQPITVDGWTQASSVIAVIKCNDGASGIVTSDALPSNDRALPYLPAAVQVAPINPPVLPVPEASVALVPLPSLNEYAATGVGPPAALIVAVVVAVVVVN